MRDGPGDLTGPRAPLGGLRTLWELWKRAARRIGDLQARVVLTLFYYVILGPFALMVRRSDPLAIKPGTSMGWRSRTASGETPMERAQRQF